MSLNWNATAIKGWDEYPKGLKETMIWATMFTDMGEITEKNAAEFFARISAFEHMRGALRTQDGKDVYITPEMVHMCIGLKTNVITITRNAWLKKLGNHMVVFTQEYNSVYPRSEK